MRTGSTISSSLIVALGVIALAGCSTGAETVASLNPPSPTVTDGGATEAGPIDSGPAHRPDATDADATDAAPASPLTFCAGTPVAGTCGQRFFQDLSECMAIPNLSACTYDSKTSGTDTFCFQGGARSKSTFDVGVPPAQRTSHGVWTNAGGTVCLEIESTLSAVSMTRNGQTLRMESVAQSDMFTLACGDGPRVSLPSGIRSCAALKALFDWSCVDGACP